MHYSTLSANALGPDPFMLNICAGLQGINDPAPEEGIMPGVLLAISSVLVPQLIQQNPFP